MDSNVITYLCLSAYKVYQMSLNATESAQRVFGFCKKVEPGQLVMEVSSIFRRDYDAIRIGTLESITREPFYTPEQWAEMGEEGEGPMETVYYIKALCDGELKRWTNAMFIRVIDDPEWLRLL